MFKPLIASLWPCEATFTPPWLAPRPQCPRVTSGATTGSSRPTAAAAARGAGQRRRRRPSRWRWLEAKGAASLAKWS